MICEHIESNYFTFFTDRKAAGPCLYTCSLQIWNSFELHALAVCEGFLIERTRCLGRTFKTSGAAPVSAGCAGVEPGGVGVTRDIM